MSVNPEDWDVDFAFPDFNLALFERERSWCRNWIVTFPWKKIGSVFENFNADHTWRREWTGRNSRRFPKKINERILQHWQQTCLEKLLCLLQCFFFTRTNGGKMETTSRKTRGIYLLQHFLSAITVMVSLRTADVSPRSSPMRDVSQGGTSATQRQKFHTDDVKSVRNPVISADWTSG